jgi:hypothetical protein
MSKNIFDTFKKVFRGSPVHKEEAKEGKLRIFKNIYSSLTLTILFEALNNEEFVFFSTTIDELKSNFGIPWRYTLLCIYYAINDDIHNLQINYTFLKSLDTPKKLKNLIIQHVIICETLLKKEAVDEVYFEEHLNVLVIVNNNLILNEILKKTFNINRKHIYI